MAILKENEQKVPYLMGKIGQPEESQKQLSQPDPADPDSVEWKWKGKTFYPHTSSENQDQNSDLNLEVMKPEVIMWQFASDNPLIVDSVKETLNIKKTVNSDYFEFY